MAIQAPSPPERLVVAADFPLEGRSPRDVVEDMSQLCRALEGTGVVIKVNTLLRLVGFGGIGAIHDAGLKVFADLKVFDIGETLKNDGELLQEFKPELLTVSADANVEGLRRLKEALPDTEVLAVLILSTFGEDDLRRRYGEQIPLETALSLQGDIADAGNADGVICAPMDLSFLRARYAERFTYVTPGIRGASTPVAGDDQNPDRVGTPQVAIAGGATRIVVGRPITRAPDPREAVKRYIGMIEEAL